MLQPTITGKVVDENNKPISDVNVFERNGTGNTRTDSNGNFTLKVASLDNDLQFSHLSYGKETISIYAFNQTKIFQFLPQLETLEEV
jgi:CarboxypepD_reg-like domain